MDIGVSKNGEWSLDAEAMRAMITGKIQWKRCFACEEGKIWVDGDEGVVCSPKFVEENEAEHEHRFYQDCCDDCNGVGFILVSCE